MTPADSAALFRPHDSSGVVVPLDPRTLEILERRRETPQSKRRGWLIRRALLAADLIGLSIALLLAELAFGIRGAVHLRDEVLIFLVLTLPAWVVLAKLYGLYDRDEERTDHPTSDDMLGVLHLVTLGAWCFFVGMWLTGVADPQVPKLIGFWGFSLVLVTALRSAARALCRRSVAYLQNTIIVGAGDVGQLIARKYLMHPEYGINLVGFVDDRPRKRREDLGNLTLLGPTERLPWLVRLLDVERVVVAFSNEPDERTLATIRSLKDVDVQLDIVPRLYEVVSPNAAIHSVEGLPLIGLPPSRMSRSSRLVKRSLDFVVALSALVVTAPLLAVIALAIRRDSEGPVLFRQVRLGQSMREFTLLKFRTMRSDVDDAAHREYIQATMSATAAPESNGLYKLERGDAVTRVGAWLRKTSLDELPQLINVLRGEMSLVGPRPCLPYESEAFAPHHFERFLVPAGLTGLWQVTARAHSTFREALEMDVAYARGWSLGLDLRLLARTPAQLLRRRGTA
jgi:exopolysaccharide biosynthesis polyprenyl glycosylphosphotransferase